MTKTLNLERIIQVARTGDHLNNQGRGRDGELVDAQIIRQREQMCPPPSALSSSYEKKQHSLLMYFLVYHAHVRISKTSERLFTKSGGEPILPE
jgi:hypothetical protein